jgi:hypothetical protein
MKPNAVRLLKVAACVAAIGWAVWLLTHANQGAIRQDAFATQFTAAAGLVGGLIGYWFRYVAIVFLLFGCGVFMGHCISQFLQFGFDGISVGPRMITGLIGGSVFYISAGLLAAAK